MIPTIRFALRINRPSPDCSASIYMRITFSRKQIITFITRKSIPIKKEHRNLSIDSIKQLPTKERYKLYYWDKQKERGTKGFRDMESTNPFLGDERKKANDILYDLNRKNKLTLSNFRREYLCTEQTNDIPFLQYCL